jgi:hypothetical protein
MKQRLHRHDECCALLLYQLSVGSDAFVDVVQQSSVSERRWCRPQFIVSFDAIVGRHPPITGIVCVHTSNAMRVQSDFVYDVCCKDRHA